MTQADIDLTSNIIRIAYPVVLRINRIVAESILRYIATQIVPVIANVRIILRVRIHVHLMIVDIGQMIDAVDNRRVLVVGHQTIEHTRRIR